MIEKEKEIHVTDVQAFLRCRRMWNWQSLLRRGLQKEEIAAPLFLGQGVHVALDHYYSTEESERSLPLLIGAFIRWMQERVETMQEFGGKLWESEREMVSDMRELGLGMLEHYWMWAQKADERFEFLSTEERFNIPMPFTEGNLAHRVRRRFGLAPTLRFAGRFDGVVRERGSGDLYLMEFKTTSRMYNMRWTMRGMQGTAYVYAARQVYGLDLKGIVYRALLKKVPSDPNPLKSGGFSQAKSQKTTFSWLVNFFGKEAARRGVADKVVFRENEKLLRYFNDVRAEDDFFNETIIHRNQKELDQTMHAIAVLGREMTDPDVSIFPLPGFHCSWCDFSDPCTLCDRGGDVEALLEAQYAPRDFWEGDDDA